jgi:hypothetical protein
LVQYGAARQGITRVLYERLNQAGVVVGGVGGYTMGRVLEIEQAAP